jgi:hypothetical protein
MQRSKLFLGLTTCILAVAAFAATKAKWHAFPACYVTCLGSKISDPNFVGSISDNTRLKTVISGITYPLFIAQCVNPLYRRLENN